MKKDNPSPKLMSPKLMIELFYFKHKKVDFIADIQFSFAEDRTIFQFAKWKLIIIPSRV